jgi:membrane protease YdiL (CAAX protease family)
MGVISCVIAAQGVALIVAIIAGAAGGDANALLQSPGLLAGVTLVQYACMAVVAVALCRIAQRLPSRGLALQRPTPGQWIGGGVAGLATLGVAAGVGAFLLELFPAWDIGSLETLGEAFITGPIGPRIALAVVVALAAPIAEEIVFRGILWDVLERRFKPRTVFVLTSLIFACWHLRPFHVLSLVPTSFLFGWLRLRTGSVLPSMAAHAVNNGIGAVILVTVGSETEAPFDPWSFGIAAVVYVLVVALVARSDPSSPTP